MGKKASARGPADFVASLLPPFFACFDMGPTFAVFRLEIGPFGDVEPFGRFTFFAGIVRHCGVYDGRKFGRNGTSNRALIEPLYNFYAAMWPPGLG